MVSSLLAAVLLAAAVPTVPPSAESSALESWDAWLESPHRVALDAGRRPADRELLARSWVTAEEPRRGVPSFLWAERFPGARSPADQGLTAVEAARQHLLRFAGVYRLSPATVASLAVTEAHDLKNGEAVVVGFGRVRENVPYLRDELDVIMTSRFELVAFSGSLATGTPIGTFRLDAPAAIAVAAQHLTGTTLATALKAEQHGLGGWDKFSRSKPFASQPRARRVYFDDADAIVPAWHLELELEGRGLWTVVVSALDGRVLSWASLTRDLAHTYRVFATATAPFRPLDSAAGNVGRPHPTGLPDGFAPPNVAPTLVTLDHGGLSTGDPWLPSGATELSGNNVHAYADLAQPDGLDAGDVSVPPSAATTFDYLYDFAQNGDAGVSQREASATQAFFTANQMHDVFYDLGFDEAARNGQASNYGRGGMGNDAVRVEVHDDSGRNNANMTTPADGEPGRLQLYLWDVPRPSTLTVTTTAFADGGLFSGVPNLMERPQGWDVSGPLMVPRDGDGGTSGCDPWDAGYAGAVVLARFGNCPLNVRIDAARDAGALALVLNGACVSATDQGLVVACLEADAGAALEAAALGGATLDARLQRPAARPELDVTFDTTVVTHEYGHFVTNRLIGDSVGLLNGPGRGMGEGWSDFISLYLSLDADDALRTGNDQWQGVYSFGAWSSQGQDFDGTTLPAWYYGVRRYPYSTDRAKNPLTFKHVGTNVPLPTTAPRAFSGNNAEVHNTGEFWAEVLWDAQVALLNAPGAAFDATKAKMGRYLVAALKATPVLPTFIEARDALLAVVFAASPTADFPRVQGAFAARGLGVLASSSDRRSTTNTPLAEDFTGVGGNYLLTSAVFDDTDDDCDADGQLDANETGTLKLTFLNVGSTRMTQSRVSLNSNIATLVLPAGSLTLPASDPFTSTSLTIPVSLGAATGLQRATVNVTVLDPQLVLLQNRLETSFTARLNVDVTAADTEDFEQDVTNWVTSREDEVPYEDEWFVRQQNATNRVMQGPDPREKALTSVTSPPIAVGAMPFTITWSHQFSFENASTFFDGGRVEISTDGTTFTAVPGSALAPTYGGTLVSTTTNPLAGQAAYVGSNGMRETVTATFGTMYANRTVWLRFVIGSDDTGSAAGWTIDDVHVTGATMPPFTSVVGHRGMCLNHVPTVSGTSSLSVAEGDAVQLIPGTAFDRDNDELTFTWMQTSGPSVQLFNGNQFDAPEVGPAGAVLGFRVTVDDGRGGTDTDDMTVAVRNVNKPPTITNTAGPQTANSGDAVALEVTAEDPDGDAITFNWEEQGEHTVTIDGVATARATFTAPKVEVPTLLSFQVLAIDSNGKAGEPAFVAVIVNPKQGGCQCTSVDPLSLVALGALALLSRRRRQRLPTTASPKRS